MTFLLLLIFSYNIIFLFVGTASLGLFLSSTFPSMLAYTEDILQYKGEWWRNTEACSLQLVATSSPAPSLLWNSRPGLSFTGKIKMPTGLVRASMFGHGCPVRGFLCLLCVSLQATGKSCGFLAHLLPLPHKHYGSADILAAIVSCLCLT